MRSKMLLLIAVGLVCLLGYKTERMLAQSREPKLVRLTEKSSRAQPKEEAPPPDPNLYGDIPRAMERAREIKEWLDAHPSEHRIHDPRPPDEMLTLPEQQWAIWSERRKTTSFGINCQKASILHPEILFSCGTFLRGSVKHLPGNKGEVEGHGFEIVCYTEGPYKGQIKQIPMEDVRMIASPYEWDSVAPVYPGTRAYNKNLPKVVWVDNSRANQKLMEAECARSGWARRGRAEAENYLWGLPKHHRFGPRFHYSDPAPDGRAIPPPPAWYRPQKLF